MSMTQNPIFLSSNKPKSVLPSIPTIKSNKSDLLKSIIEKGSKGLDLQKLSSNLDNKLSGLTTPAKVRLLEVLLVETEKKIVRHAPGGKLTSHENRHKNYLMLGDLIKLRLSDLDTKAVGQFFDKDAYIKTKFSELGITDSQSTKQLYGSLKGTDNAEKDKDLTALVASKCNEIVALKLSIKDRQVLLNELELMVRKSKETPSFFSIDNSVVNHNSVCDLVATAITVEKDKIDIPVSVATEKAAYLAAVPREHYAFPLKKMISDVQKKYDGYNSVALGSNTKNARTITAFTTTLTDLLTVSGPFKSSFDKLVTSGSTPHAHFLNLVKILKTPAKDDKNGVLKTAALYKLLSNEEFASINVANALAEVGRRGLVAEEGLAMENADVLFPLELLGTYLDQTGLMKGSDNDYPIQHLFMQLSNFSDSNLVTRSDADMFIVSDRQSMFDMSSLKAGRLLKKIQTINPDYKMQAARNASQGWMYQLASPLTDSSQTIMKRNDTQFYPRFIRQVLSSLYSSSNSALEKFHDSSDYNDSSLIKNDIHGRISSLISKIPNNEHSSLIDVLEMKNETSVSDELIELHQVNVNDLDSTTPELFSPAVIRTLHDEFNDMYSKGQFKDDKEVAHVLSRLVNLLSSLSKEENLARLNSLRSLIKKPSIEILLHTNKQGNKDLLPVFLDTVVRGASADSQSLLFGLEAKDCNDLWMAIVQDESLNTAYFSKLVNLLSPSYFKSSNSEYKAAFNEFLVENVSDKKVSEFFSKNHMKTWLVTVESVGSTSANGNIDGNVPSIGSSIIDLFKNLFAFIDYFQTVSPKDASQSSIDVKQAGVSFVADYLQGKAVDSPQSFSKLESGMFLHGLSEFTSRTYSAPITDATLLDVDTYRLIENKILEGTSVLDAMNDFQPTATGRVNTQEQFDTIKELYLNMYVLHKAQSRVTTQGVSSLPIMQIVSPDKAASKSYILDVLFKTDHTTKARIVDLAKVLDIVSRSQDDPKLRNIQLHFIKAGISDLLEVCKNDKKDIHVNKDLKKAHLDELTTALLELVNGDALFDVSAKILEESPQTFMSQKAFVAKQSLLAVCRSNVDLPISTARTLLASIETDVDRRVFVADLVADHGIVKGAEIVRDLLNKVLDKSNSESVALHFDYLESMIKLFTPSNNADKELNEQLNAVQKIMQKLYRIVSGSVETHSIVDSESLLTIFQDGYSSNEQLNQDLTASKYLPGLEARLSTTWTHPIFQEFVGSDSVLLLDYMDVQARHQAKRFCKSYRPSLEESVGFTSSQYQLLEGKFLDLLKESPSLTNQEYATTILTMINTLETSEKVSMLNALPLLFKKHRHLDYTGYKAIISADDFEHAAKDIANSSYDNTDLNNLTVFSALQLEQLNDASRVTLQNFVGVDLTISGLGSYSRYAIGINAYQQLFEQKYLDVISKNPTYNVNDLIKATSLLLNDKYSDKFSANLFSTLEKVVTRKISGVLDHVFSEVLDLYQFSVGEDGVSSRKNLTVIRVKEYIESVEDASLKQAAKAMFFDGDSFREEYFSLFQNGINALATKDDSKVSPTDLLVKLSPQQIKRTLIDLQIIYSVSKSTKGSENTKVLKWLLYSLLKFPEKFEAVMKVLPLDINRSLFSDLVDQFSSTINDNDAPFPMETAVRIVQNVFNKYKDKGAISSFYTQLSMRLSTEKFNELFNALSEDTDNVDNSTLLGELVKTKFNFIHIFNANAFKRFLKVNNLDTTGSSQLLRERIEAAGLDPEEATKSRRYRSILNMLGVEDLSGNMPALKTRIQNVPDFNVTLNEKGTNDLGDRVAADIDSFEGEFLTLPKIVLRDFINTDIKPKAKAAVLSTLSENYFKDVWTQLSDAQQFSYFPFLNTAVIKFVSDMDKTFISKFVSVNKNDNVSLVTALVLRSDIQNKQDIVDAYFSDDILDINGMQVLLNALYSNSQFDDLREIVTILFNSSNSQQVTAFMQSSISDASLHAAFNKLIDENTDLSLIEKLLVAVSERTSSNGLQFPTGGIIAGWVDRLFGNNVFSTDQLASLFIHLLQGENNALGRAIPRKLTELVRLDVLNNLFENDATKKYMTNFLDTLSDADKFSLLNDIHNEADSFEALTVCIKTFKDSYFATQANHLLFR
jgi:hypothetical protein